MRTDVRLLRNEVTIGSNTLFLLFAEMGYLPSFYTVEDRLVAEDRAGVINSIQGTTKVVPWDLRGVIRQDASTLYVNFIRDYRNGPLFSDDFAGRVYWGGTVTFLNLQLAYHLGCDPVYLIGFDHGYSVPQEDVTSGTASAERGQNHFHKDSYGPGFRWNDPQFDRMERAYRVAKRHFEAEGRSILNATDGGRLEVFQRVDFTEVLKRDY